MRTDAAPLIEAKKEYIEQLQQLIAKKIYGIFYEFFIHTVETNDEVELIFSDFQKQMEEIRQWNHDKASEYSRMIIEDEEFFSQLITTVLILKTKIMTSFKIDNQQKNVQLKVPSNEHFIHRCFMIVGNHFYNNPFVFVVDDNKRINTERYKDCMNMIHSAIEETITFFVPVKNILKEYIGVKEPEGVPQEPPKEEPSPDISKETEEKPDPSDESENEVRTIQGVAGTTAAAAATSAITSTVPVESPATVPEPPIVASPMLPSPSNIPEVAETKDVRDSDVYPSEQGSMVPFRPNSEAESRELHIGEDSERYRRAQGAPTTFDSDSDSDSESDSPRYEYEPSEDGEEQPRTRNEYRESSQRGYQ